jgi:hypothetical protein
VKANKRDLQAGVQFYEAFQFAEDNNITLVGGYFSSFIQHAVWILMGIQAAMLPSASSVDFSKEGAMVFLHLP